MRKKLKEARKNSGFTQQEMADRINVSLRQYQRIESGDTMSSYDIWDVLEDILGVHQWILRENEDNRHGT